MTDEQINTTALREHTGKGWGDDCLLPKASVNRMADELDSLRVTASTKPVGEDAANGAMGEREAFEVWWNANQTWPVAAKNLAFLAWNTRASLAAEKVAAQELVDEEGDDLDDEYPGTPTSRQAARVGVLEFHLRRIVMSYEAGDKARVPLPTVIEGVREFLLENGWKRDAVKLFAAPQPAQSPDGRTIDKAMVKRLAVQHGLLPVHPSLTDGIRKLIECAADCISEAVTWEQSGFDTPPMPATEWDYNADQLAYALRALLTAAQPPSGTPND